jgi:hypothetical protein
MFLKECMCMCAYICEEKGMNIMKGFMMKRVVGGVICAVFTITGVLTAGQIAKDDVIYAGGTSATVWVINGLDLSTWYSKNAGSDVTAVAFQRDGDIVVGTKGGTVKIYDSGLTVEKATASLDADQPAAAREITSLAVQSDDSVVVGMRTYNGSVFVLDPNDLSYISRQSWFGGSSNPLVLVAVQSNDNTVIAVDNGYNDTQLWLRTWDPTVGIANNNTIVGVPTGLALQSDGRVILGTTWNNGTLYLCNAQTISTTYYQEYLSSAANPQVYVAVQSNDNIIAACGNMKVWRSDKDFSSASRVTTDLYGGPLSSVSIQSDDEIVVTGDRNGGTVFLMHKNFASAELPYKEAGFFGLPGKAVAWNPKAFGCEDIWKTGQGLPGDLDHNCKVNFKDFAMFASSWLKCNNPDQSQCN